MLKRARGKLLWGNIGKSDPRSETLSMLGGGQLGAPKDVWSAAGELRDWF